MLSAGVQTMRGEGASVRTRGYALSGAMRLYMKGPAVLNPHLGHSKTGPVFGLPLSSPTVSIGVGGNSYRNSASFMGRSVNAGEVPR